MYKVIRPQHQSDIAQPHDALAVDAHYTDTLPNEVATVPAPKRYTKAELAEAFADELSSLRQAAQQQGYQEGKQHAEQAQQQLADALKQDADGYLNALKSLLDSLPSAFEAYLKQQEPELLALLFESLSKILGDMAAEKTLIEKVLTTAMAKCGAEHNMMIHVSPQDYDVLQQMQFWQRFPSFKQLDCVADPAVEVGGCIIETPKGKLDAQLSLQLQRLQQLLQDVYLRRGRD